MIVVQCGVLTFSLIHMLFEISRVQFKLFPVEPLVCSSLYTRWSLVGFIVSVLTFFSNISICKPVMGSSPLVNEVVNLVIVEWASGECWLGFFSQSCNMGLSRVFKTFEIGKTVKNLFWSLPNRVTHTIAVLKDVHAVTLQGKGLLGATVVWLL